MHSIASESTSDSAHTTWPQYTGTVSDTESEDDAAFDLLGMLVDMVDDADSGFVHGPPGTPGRPDGMIHVSFLASTTSGE